MNEPDDLFNVYIYYLKNKNNYFIIQSKLIDIDGKHIRIVKLGSVCGHIGMNFDSEDEQLNEIIKKYSNENKNVKSLNILDKKMNRFDQSISVENSNKFKKEDPDNSSENSAQKYTPELKENIIQSTNNLLIKCEDEEENKEESENYVHSEISKNIPPSVIFFSEDNFEYTGSSQIRRSKNGEQITTIEVLLYILSERFAEFKAELLELVGIDPEIIKNENQPPFGYIKLESDNIIQILEEKVKHIQQDEELREIPENIINVPGEGVDENNNLNNISAEIINLVQQSKEDILTFINQQIPQGNIIIGNMDEVFIIIKDSEGADRVDHGEDEVILDTISCKLIHERNNLRYHDPLRDKDNIIKRFVTNNSMGLYNFLKDNTLDIAEYLNSVAKDGNEGYIRKIKLKRENYNTFLERIDELIITLGATRRDLIELVEDSNNAIIQRIDQLLGGYRGQDDADEHRNE